MIELRTDAAQKVNRAYGTTGIITALEMPLAPAWPWIDVIVAFDDFFEAMRVGYDVALADGVVKKLITPMIWPIPQHFPALKAHCPEGKSVIFAMIAEPSLESFKAILGNARHDHFRSSRTTTARQGAALRIHLEPHDPAVAQAGPHHHLSAMPVPARPPDRVGAADERDVPGRGAAAHRIHPLRRQGHLLGAADRALHHRGAAERDHRAAREHGVFIANPHVYTLEDGTRHKSTGADQLGIKAEVDPYGLLNPGKMRTYMPVRN